MKPSSFVELSVQVRLTCVPLVLAVAARLPGAAGVRIGVVAVAVFEGAFTNIKITSPEDMTIANALARERLANAGASA